MKKGTTLNMTQGSPFKLLAIFALPMLIGNIFQQAYNLADSVIVGKILGADALAAIGATSSVTFLFFSISGGISSGCGIITSQFFGAGNDKKVRQTIANSAYIMFCAALVMGLTAFALAEPALRLMGTPEVILPTSLSYMRMTCLGVPVVVVYNYSSSMLRALGDSRTPLYFLIVSCILNIGIDILFVSIGMGVFGAALATVIAQALSGIGCLIFAIRHNPYFRLTKEDWVLDFGTVKRSVRLGLPLALQWSLIAVSTMGLQSFVNTFGTSTMAAFTAVSRVESLLHQPYNSLSAALSTYAGQNYGAGNIGRIRDGVKKGAIMGAVFSVLMLIAFQTLQREIIGLFIDEEEVIGIGARALEMTSWFYFFLSMIYVTRGTLNGIGDALFSFINGIVEMICRVFMPRLIFLIPGIGMWSIWWTTGITWIISAVFCFMRYLAWRKKTLSGVIPAPLTPRERKKLREIDE